MLEPLDHGHKAADDAGWTSSIEHIRATPGFEGRTWSGRVLSVEDNDKSIGKHLEHAKQRVGFTYAVISRTSGGPICCASSRCRAGLALEHVAVPAAGRRRPSIVSATGWQAGVTITAWTLRSAPLTRPRCASWIAARATSGGLWWHAPHVADNMSLASAVRSWCRQRSEGFVVDAHQAGDDPPTAEVVRHRRVLLLLANVASARRRLAELAFGRAEQKPSTQAVTQARRNTSTVMGWRRRQVMAIGRSPSCET